MAVKELFSTIMLCLLVLGLTLFNPLGYIRSNEPIENNQELEIHVNLNNDVDDDLDNVRIRTYILDDLDDFVLYSNNIEINEGEKASAWLFWDVPSYVPADDYLVRVVANGDGFKDVDYTWVTVY